MKHEAGDKKQERRIRKSCFLFPASCFGLLRLRCGLMGTTFIMLLLTVISCARQPKITAEIRGDSLLPDQVVSRLSSAQKISTLKAYAHLEIDLRGRKKRLDAAIAIRQPDDMRVDFIDQLSGSIATLIVSGERLVYLDAGGLEVKEGDESKFTFWKLMKLPWNIRQTIDVLLGRLPESVNLDGVFPVDGDGRFWIREKGSFIEYKDDELVYVEVNSRMKPIVKVRLSDCFKIGRIDFSKSIEIDFVEKRSKLKLSYREAELNKPIEIRFFDVGNGRIQ